MGRALKLIPTIVGLAVLVQVLPAYYRHNEFENYLKLQARSVTTAQHLKQDLLTKAREYALSLEAGNIDVRTFDGTFRVAVDYMVPIELLFYRQNLKFRAQASGFLPR